MLCDHGRGVPATCSVNTQSISALGRSQGETLLHCCRIVLYCCSFAHHAAHPLTATACSTPPHCRRLLHAHSLQQHAAYPLTAAACSTPTHCSVQHCTNAASLPKSLGRQSAASLPKSLDRQSAASLPKSLGRQSAASLLLSL